MAGSLGLLKTELREIAAVILELIVKFDVTNGGIIRFFVLTDMS